jgi:DNA-binding NtrC family response regulator
MTGFDSPEAAIKAMKLGAYDYIVKPDKLDDWPGFLDLLERAVRNSRLMSEPVEVGKASFSRDAIIGRSGAMQEVYKQIGLVAARPVTVLIRGETGTGKELVARAIYQHSDRAKRPFTVVDCVAIREHLLETELFGSESGGFAEAKAQRIGRFEQANHGTIFLNEIGEMSSSIQVKLLRLLSDRVIQRLGGKATIAVDVRIIAATQRNLELAVKENKLREDLYYWLKDSVITLPPLRERREDIPEWVRYFIQRYAAELGSSTGSMPTPDAMAFLKEQQWPGNVRELRNIVRTALLMARDYPITDKIVKDALAQARLPQSSADGRIAAYVSELLTKAERGEVEKVHTVLIEAVELELYRQAIRQANGDQAKAAGWLGVSRPTIREKLLKYNLHPSQLGTAAP